VGIERTTINSDFCTNQSSLLLWGCCACQFAITINTKVFPTGWGEAWLLISKNLWELEVPHGSGAEASQHSKLLVVIWIFLQKWGWSIAMISWKLVANNFLTIVGKMEQQIVSKKGSNNNQIGIKVVIKTGNSNKSSNHSFK